MSVNAGHCSPLGYVSCCGESTIFHCCCFGEPAAALQHFLAGKKRWNFSFCFLICPSYIIFFCFFLHL